MAVDEAQAESRRSGSAAAKWWLTFATKRTCCAKCGGLLRAGRELVYRREPREALCVLCADALETKYRPSVAWERKRSAGRSR